MTTHDSPEIRATARRVAPKHGLASLWHARHLHGRLTGRTADRSWGWERTLTEAFRADDAPRLGPARREIELGLAAQARGDLDAMAGHFRNAIGTTAGTPDGARMAPGYALLGANYARKDDLVQALRAHDTAIALAPHLPQRRLW